MSSHPLGDIFFLSDDNELVLIDVTASMDSSSALTTKRRHIKIFSEAWRKHPPRGLRLLVAIVNPLDMSSLTRPSGDCTDLRYIYGEDARELLGGLVQFLPWYN